MLGSLILYLKGMRTTMFQLSGFYCKPKQPPRVPRRDCRLGKISASRAPRAFRV